MESNSHVNSKSSFMGKTLCLMGVGVLITFMVGIWMRQYVMGLSSLMFFGIVILELIMVITLGKRATSMPTSAAMFWFLVYSAVNGITLSVIFTSVHLGQLITLFALTSIMFFCSGMIGVITKKDLSVIGQFATMYIIGLVVLMIMQIFIVSTTFNIGLSLLGITVFCGLTAYDMQKIKHIQTENNDMRGITLAALTLYLDFINLFIFAIRLVNGRR